MGKLLNIEKGYTVCLKSSHVMGRDPVISDTLTVSQTCSRIQCILRFQGGDWLFFDKSKNGSLLNGKPVKTISTALVVGDKISFPGDCEGWRLIDAEEPKPMLVQASSQDFLELSKINILPEESNPEILLSLQGEDWIVESGNHMNFIQGGDIINLNQENWIFWPNDLIQETLTHCYSNQENLPLKLLFEISLNEENIRLIVDFQNEKINFGYKSHHELLLFLARHRIVDENRQVPFNEQGWLATDVLLIELGIEANHLNILIYRLRKAFEDLGYQGILIERRQGEIRIKECEITLHKGDEIVVSQYKQLLLAE